MLDSAAAREELALVEDFARRARALPRDGKADSLVKAVRLVMARRGRSRSRSRGPLLG